MDAKLKAACTCTNGYGGKECDESILKEIYLQQLISYSNLVNNNNNNLKRKLYNCRIQGQSLSNQGRAEYLHRQRVGGERETSGRVGQVVQSENRRVEEL